MGLLARGDSELRDTDFPDPTAPVYLHTDASDYGTGAYLFQIIDGLEICFALLSETLAYRGGVTLVGD